MVSLMVPLVLLQVLEDVEAHTDLKCWLIWCNDMAHINDTKSLAERAVWPFYNHGIPQK